MLEDNNIYTSKQMLQYNKNTAFEHLSLLCDNPDG